MATEPADALERLKKFDLSSATVTFWLVKRKSANREANYSVLRVDIDEQLQSRFRGYVKQQLQGRTFHLEKYDFTNADTDDVLLTLDSGSTDFPEIEKAINQGFDNPRVKEYRDLLNSWAYVIHLENSSGSLYAWRKINAMTQPKKVKSRTALLFRNHQLIDVDEDEVFLIDSHFDFFVVDGMVLIASKREFEVSMNFRDGIKRNAIELLERFEALAFLSNVGPIRDFVGDNLHHLRKLASIKKSGYYEQADYLKRLAEVSLQEGWSLKSEDGKIVVEVETVELLLKLLNNDRLRSPINQELFDSAAKIKVV